MIKLEKNDIYLYYNYIYNKMSVDLLTDLKKVYFTLLKCLNLKIIKVKIQFKHFKDYNL